MKVPTIAAIIVAAGLDKYGEQNYKAAKAYLEAGGKTETEAEPDYPVPPYDPDEALDFSLLLDNDDDQTGE